ncbi:zinc finger protein-domain-containing protein [Chaetomium fimeti]|uniref:Zinc finger protein-domain-containing protein n=1 Tax=Chaetomium fimeti TaxID=1854472 RepID=A0AAE0H7F1_9PEZI|nr:zinc finger protein-domain-containing protein [Chaetomium fimeti]
MFDVLDPRNLIQTIVQPNMQSLGDIRQRAQTTLAQLTIAQSDAPLQRIGYGSCGSVWADSSEFPDIDKCETALVLKRADGLPDRSLENEAQIHKHLLSKIGAPQAQGIFTTAFRVNIPRHIQFLQPGTPSWTDILRRLPPQSVACQALVSERILPLPRDSRRLVVEKFWNGPEDMRDSIVNDKRNEHCLIRLYLGRRRTGTRTGAGGEPRRSMLKSISLRNYPLHIDQVEALGLPAHEYASAMADSLAFLLWVAEIDACDVEFVLARPRPTDLPMSNPCHLGTRAFTSSVLGLHVLWMLDFDCCKKLPMSVDGVRLAAERFWRNDPFYPNPNAKCKEDVGLWELFKSRFLETSGKVMASKDETIRRLPEQFITRIVETIGVYSKGVPSASGDTG